MSKGEGKENGVFGPIYRPLEKYDRKRSKDVGEGRNRKKKR
jgi:hypothetical protein